MLPAIPLTTPHFMLSSCCPPFPSLFHPCFPLSFQPFPTFSASPFQFPCFLPTVFPPFPMHLPCVLSLPPLPPIINFSSNSIIARPPFLACSPSSLLPSPLTNLLFLACLLPPFSFTCFLPVALRAHSENIFQSINIILIFLKFRGEPEGARTTRIGPLRYSL